MDKINSKLSEQDQDIITSMPLTQLDNLYGTLQDVIKRTLPLLKELHLISHHKKIYLFEGSLFLKQYSKLDKLFGQISSINKLSLIFDLINKMVNERRNKEKLTAVRPVTYNKKLEQKIQLLAEESEQELVCFYGAIKNIAGHSKKN